MLLNDIKIRKYCTLPAYHNGRPMVEPFVDLTPEERKGKISYGLTSSGYDVRLATEVWAFRSNAEEIVDPKRFGEPGYRDKVMELVRPRGETPTGQWIILPPGGYVLGMTFEYLRIPRHLKARCVGKSTLARVMVMVNTTPLEPGWEGHLTLEIGNVGPCPMKLPVMEGIAQLEFELLTDEPEKDYTARGAKYQNQTEVTVARVR